MYVLGLDVGGTKTHAAVAELSGKIIGEGFHRQYGQLHAEREAIKDG